MLLTQDLSLPLSTAYKGEASVPLTGRQCTPPPPSPNWSAVGLSTLCHMAMHSTPTLPQLERRGTFHTPPHGNAAIWYLKEMVRAVNSDPTFWSFCNVIDVLMHGKYFTARTCRVVSQCSISTSWCRTTWIYLFFTVVFCNFISMSLLNCKSRVA